LDATLHPKTASYKDHLGSHATKQKGVYGMHRYIDTNRSPN